MVYQTLGNSPPILVGGALGVSSPQNLDRCCPPVETPQGPGLGEEQLHAGAGVGPSEALPHPLGVPLPRGVSPYLVPRVHLGALHQQPLHHAQVPTTGSEMERRRVVLVGRRGAGGTTGVRREG